MVDRIARVLLVRDHERTDVLYFLGIFLLISAGMALGRGSADALFFKRYGIEYLPLMYLALSVLLMVVSTVYAAFSDRLPAEQFFKYLLITVAVLLGINWLVITTTGREFAYPAYFLIYEVTSELLLVHGALYFTQNFDTLQAKRLLPLVFAGGQIGTIAGGASLAAIAPAIGVHNVLLLWGALLAATLAVLYARHRRTGTSPHFRAGRKSQQHIKQAIDQVAQGLSFLRDSELLRNASYALFFMVITFYVLCYSVNRIYTTTFQTEEQLTAFFGILTVITSSLALALQLFVTNRVLRRFGVKRVNLIFPTTTLLSYGALALSFTLPAAILSSVNKDALLSSFRAPVRNMFFNALPGYMQGRARAMSVALVMPGALAVAGGFLYLAQHFQEPRYFVLLGGTAAAIYLYFNRRMNRSYVASLISVLKQKVYVPGRRLDAALKGKEGEILNELVRGVEHDDDDVCLAYAKILLQTYPQHAPAVIVPRLRGANNKTGDQLIKLLVPHEPPELYAALQTHLEQADNHLKATILTALIESNHPTEQLGLASVMEHQNPRIRAEGVYGIMRRDVRELRERAEEIWHLLLTSSHYQDNIAGLEILAKEPDIRHRATLLSLLNHSHERVVLAALDALTHWPETRLPGLEERLQRLSDHPAANVRERALRCLKLLPPRKAQALGLRCLEDDHPAVRAAAVSTLVDIVPDAIHTLATPILENSVSLRAQDTLLESLREHPDRELMHRIATAKVEDADALRSARLGLQQPGGPSDEATVLLGIVLNEHFQKSVELALLAMEAVEDPDTLRVIRAGVSSQDARHIANACEALRYLENESLARLLTELLEPVDHAQMPSRTDRRFADTNSVITWCLGRADRWLLQCAEDARLALAGSEA